MLRCLGPGQHSRVGTVLGQGDLASGTAGGVLLCGRGQGHRERRHHGRDQHQGSPHRTPTLPQGALRSGDVVSSPPRPLPLHLTGVGFQRDGRWILDDITWSVASDQRWLVLGANGSGKTSLLRIASLYEHPTRGQVQVLGETLGHTDVRSLRRRIGVTSAALAAQFRPSLTAHDVVMTARYAALEPWWHTYDDDDRRRAHEALGRLGVGHLAQRTLGTLSSGEAQRVLLARTLVNEPALVLLDEPSARLDLGGREQLVGALAELVADAAAPVVVLVTHHLDEVPPGMTHALLLRDGRVLDMGAFDDVITSQGLSECFGVSLAVERRRNGRLSATAAG
jgi:iron complex transport system ATP-binding protein